MNVFKADWPPCPTPTDAHEGDHYTCTCGHDWIAVIEDGELVWKWNV